MQARRAVVVGAGPNGLTAAARLAREGWRVDVFEAAAGPGGAARTSDTALGSGALVDMGAAAHPFGTVSPAFTALGLERHGLQWVQPRYPLAHPSPSGLVRADEEPAAILHRSVEQTVAELGNDSAFRFLHEPVARSLKALLPVILSPLSAPYVPSADGAAALVRFGARALWPARYLGAALLRNSAARALLVGSAAHAVTPPSQLMTASIGVFFDALGMTSGWPMARGGSQAITDALVRVIEDAGGAIHCGQKITDMDQLPDADAVLLDLAPRGVLGLGGLNLAPRVARRLRRWRYGPGVYKVDYLLDGPVPWSDPRVAEAGTVHVGGSAADIDRAEQAVAAGRMPRHPFVMVCQQDAADATRRPPGGQRVLWTYAHVPNGYPERYPGEVCELIESQIERCAPGFRAGIVKRHVRTPADLEAWDANLVGGDIAAGAMSGTQLLLRPGISLDPYRVTGGERTPVGKGPVYLCSAATPPGGGVHGMCGWNAAGAVLADAHHARNFVCA